MENEPATKADVKATLDAAELRLHERIDAAVEAAELRLLERIEAFETRLVTEFRKWAVPVMSSIKVHQTYAVGFDARLSLVEERLNELERR
jgi:hypothetical protein